MSWTNKRAGFFAAFRYAWNGVWHCLRNERNFRFHLVFAAYVFGFAPYFSLSRAEWAVLCLTVGCVWCAELFNSAIERTVNRISTEQHPLSGTIKDIAAGAVLVLAMAAVGVGITLFWKPAAWVSLFTLFCTQWWRPCVLLVSLLPAWLFVFKGR